MKDWSYRHCQKLNRIVWALCDPELKGLNLSDWIQADKDGTFFGIRQALELRQSLIELAFLFQREEAIESRLRISPLCAHSGRFVLPTRDKREIFEEYQLPAETC